MLDLFDAFKLAGKQLGPQRLKGHRHLPRVELQDSVVQTAIAALEEDKHYAHVYLAPRFDSHYVFSLAIVRQAAQLAGVNVEDLVKSDITLACIDRGY